MSDDKKVNKKTISPDDEPESKENITNESTTTTRVPESLIKNTDSVANSASEKAADAKRLTELGDATPTLASTTLLYLQATRALVENAKMLPTKMISTENVAPKINSINSAYSDFSKYKPDSFNKGRPETTFLIATDVVRHFFGVVVDTSSSGTMNLVPDGAINMYRSKYAEMFNTPIKNGFNTIYQIIDSNLPGFEITIDPHSERLTDFVEIGDIITIITNILGTETVISNGSNTMFKLWALALKVISKSHMVGNFTYVTNPLLRLIITLTWCHKVIFRVF